MDEIKQLINQLTLAVNRGEDKSTLLAMVNSLKIALENESSNSRLETEGTNDLITIIRPEKNRSGAAKNLFSPLKPPRIIAVNQDEPDLLGDQLLKKALIPEFEKANPVGDQLSRTPPLVIAPVFASKIDPKPLPPEHIDIAKVEEQHFLPLTDEMIAEAITQELRALQTPDVSIATELLPNESKKPELGEPPSVTAVGQGTKSGKELNDAFQSISKFEFISKPKIESLKSGITIGDRFQWIQHLFDNNERLYQESIEHIDQFKGLQEAIFWVESELRNTLKWDPESELVQQFYDTVRRRFS